MTTTSPLTAICWLAFLDLLLCTPVLVVAVWRWGL